MSKLPITFGDMLVSGSPPAKLIKAAAVIADTMHPEFERYDLNSKGACVLSSLAVRDFLFKIGFRSAEVVPVVFVIRAFKDGDLLHSLGIGDPSGKDKDLPGRWSGHMITRLPHEGFLLDTTLYQAARPQWPELPGMVLAPLAYVVEPVFGLDVIAGFHKKTDDARHLDGLWLEQPKNKGWRGAKDTLRRRRAPIVEAMIKRFGNWTD